MNGCGPNPDEYFVVSNCRFVDLCECQMIR
jgi:hypothetical protein